RNQVPTPTLAAKALARAWRILRLRALRHYNLKALPFIAVFEKHKSGWPHLHLMLRAKWLDQRWLSAQMHDILNSHRVDIRRIKRQSQIAGYCAKYVGKEPWQFGTSKRYWKSRDYELREDRKTKPDLPPETTFQRKEKPFEDVIKHFEM